MPAPSPRRFATALAALLLAAACWRLGHEGLRFLADPVDLRLRHWDVGRWFAGEPIYGVHDYAVYPPASHLLLWPLVGHGDLASARVRWLLSAALAAVVLLVLLVRLARPRDRVETAVVVLTPLAGYATAATLGNGQLGLQLLAALLAALWLLQRFPTSWWRDLAVAALLLLSLLKPSFSAPMVLLVALLPGGWRAVLLSALGYLGLTALAALPQPDSALALLADWLRVAPSVHAFGGYGDLASWLRRAGLSAHTLEVSGVALLALAVWLWRHRQHDPWLLLGVAGLVARLCFYHRLFDDLLLLLPLLALWRAWRRDAERATLLSLLLLWGAGLAPASPLAGPEPWATLLAAGQSGVWLLALVQLVRLAGRGRARLHRGETEVAPLATTSA